MSVPETEIGRIPAKPPRSTAPPEAAADDFALLEVVTVALKRRRLIAGLIVAAMAATVIWSISQPRLYVASGQFVPISNFQRSQVGGIAAQLGFSMPSDVAASSPKFYSDLMLSRAVLEAVAADEYAVTGGEGDGGTATLFEIMGYFPPLSTNERLAAVRSLRGRVTTAVDRETGVVSFDVMAESPGLAEALGDRLISTVNTANVRARQRQAEAEQEFVTDRLDDSRERLLEAEQRLKTFLTENRLFQSSPELAFQHDRLAREVNTRQEVYLTLTKSLEESRIDAVRNTPVITILENPRGSARPESRGTLARGLIAGFLAGLLGIALAFTLEFNRRLARSDREDYREFDDVWRATVRDLSAPLRWVRRLLAPSSGGGKRGRSP